MELNDHIFDFASIFSAILITYIISKIFQIRNEKINIQKDVTDLCNRITDFRRICSIIINNNDVWDSQTRSVLNGKYKKLTYNHLFNDYEKNKPQDLINEYFENEKEGNIKAGKFYIGLRDFAHPEPNGWNLELFEEFDEDIIYPLGLLKNWNGNLTANVFYYYLEDEYSNYKNDIRLEKLSETDVNRISNLSAKIDRKFFSRTVDAEFLVEIGNYMMYDLMPRLERLLKVYEQKMSSFLQFAIINLFAIVFFGVLVPLGASSIDIGDLFFLKVIVYVSVLAITFLLLIFILDFFRILKREIEN